MKKSVKMAFAGVLAMGAFTASMLVGCSPLSPVENKESGIIYNGGNVVSVGDYLFYANGFVSGVNDFSTSSDAEYKEAQKYAYLSRVGNEGFEKSKYKNENNVEKVSDLVSGYSNSYMFVLGNYIYFIAPNLHKTGENKHVWQYVTIYRTNLSGGDSSELFTTTAYDASKAEIKALEFGGEYFLVIFDGTNLVKLNLGNKVSSSVLAENVTSVALPDEGESWNGKIYFTKDRETSVGQKGNVVYTVDIKTGSVSDPICNENDLTITFTGRVEDKIFYTRKNEKNSVSETYVLDSANQTSSFASSGKRFYPLEISSIDKIAEGNTEYEGYVFTANISDKTQVMYYNNFAAENSLSYEAEVLVDGSEGYANTVANFGTDFYYMTSDSIVRKDIIAKDSDTIVSDMTISNTLFGYDFAYVDGEISRLNNIYFYAQVPEDPDKKEDSEEEETDTNYYLFGIDARGVNDAFLVGKKA